MADLWFTRIFEGRLSTGEFFQRSQWNWWTGSPTAVELIPSLHPSPSKPSLHFAPQEAAKNGTTSTLETPSTFDLSSPSALGATLVSEFCSPKKNGPNLLNKNQWKYRCTASNLNISKHIFKYNQGTAWKTRKTPALQLLRMAHTSQDGQHFILPNLRRRFFHTKKLWYWQMPFHSWAQTCLFKFSGGRPPFSYSTYSNESQYLCQNGTSN